MSIRHPNPHGVDPEQAQSRLRRMLGLSVFNFGLVSAPLLLYAAIGSNPWSGPLCYLVVSLGGSAVFW